MRISGLGSFWPSAFSDTQECGENPCTWIDNVYARENCAAFLQCGYPTDPTTIAINKGLIAGMGSSAGQAVGATTGGLFTGLVESGIGGWLVLAGIGIGGIVLIKSLR